MKILSRVGDVLFGKRLQRCPDDRTRSVLLDQKLEHLHDIDLLQSRWSEKVVALQNANRKLHKKISQISKRCPVCQEKYREISVIRSSEQGHLFCYTNTPQVLVPCGHTVCNDCMFGIAVASDPSFHGQPRFESFPRKQVKKILNCPICRAEVQGVVTLRM